MEADPAEGSHRHIGLRQSYLAAQSTPCYTCVQTPKLMFAIDSQQLVSEIRSLRASREFELRGVAFDLIRLVTRHEIEVLCGRNFCRGQVNKKGLQYVQLTVSNRMAAALLRKMVQQSRSTVAEDNRTIGREMFGLSDTRTGNCAGIVYSHRPDMDRVWKRGKHWSNWGARGRGPRAAVVVPRFA